MRSSETHYLGWDCYLHTRHSGRIPAAKGTVVGAQETARQCTTRQAHTHTAISALPTHEARAMLTCTAVHHASGTHTHRAYETALHTKFAHIRYALTSYFSGCCHTPPRSSASCGSLALQPSYPLVNAVLRDTLPRMGLLFAHKTQRTHPSCENRESRTALC